MTIRAMIDGVERDLTPEEEGAFLAEQAAVTPRVPQYISRQRCAMQMCIMGLIDAAEMVAMAQAATPPALVEGLLSQMPEPDQSFARAQFAEASYSRNNPLLVLLMTGREVPDGNGGTHEATAEDIDQFFITADAL